MSESNLRTLEAVAQAWGSWMWSMSWQLTLLVLVLVLLDRLLRGYSARLRFTLWLLVLVRLIIPPDFAAPTALTWWLGDRIPAANQSLSASLAGWLTESTGNVESPSSTAARTASETVATLADGEAAVETRAGAEAQVPAAQSAAARWPQMPDDALTWTGTLFLLWIGIVGARLSFLLVALLQVRKWLRTAIEINDPVALGIFDSARARVGVGREIRVCDSHACTTPLVTGCLRPVILLPSNVLASLDSAELEAVLVHELAHVARRDGWIRLAQSILSAVYFFHPALWLANWFLRRTCEDACDEQTIAALAGRRRSYAEAIVKAATAVGYEPPHLAMSMLDNAYPVKRRLQRILDPRLRFAEGGWLGRWAFASVTALLLLPSGSPATSATQPELTHASEASASTADAVVVDPVNSQASADDTARATTNQPQDAKAALAVNQLSSVNEERDDGDKGDSRADGVAVKTEQTGATAAADGTVETELLELRALAELQSNDFQERMQAYADLQRIGGQRSLDQLEAAFLKRAGIEQDAAKRALDAVWKRLPRTPTESSNSVRLFQVPQEN